MKIFVAVYDPSELSNDGSFWAFHPHTVTKSLLERFAEVVRKHTQHGKSATERDFIGGYFSSPEYGVYFKFVDGGRDSRNRPGRTPIIFLLAPIAGSVTFNIFDLFQNTSVLEVERNVVRRHNLTSAEEGLTIPSPDLNLQPVDSKYLKQLVDEARFGEVLVESNVLTFLISKLVKSNWKMLEVARRNGQTKMLLAQVESFATRQAVTDDIDLRPVASNKSMPTASQKTSVSSTPHSVRPQTKPNSVFEKIRSYAVLTAAFILGLVFSAAFAILYSVFTNGNATALQVSFEKTEVALDGGDSLAIAVVANPEGKLNRPCSMLVTLSDGPARLASLKFADRNESVENGSIVLALPKGFEFKQVQAQITIKAGPASENARKQTLRLVSFCDSSIVQATTQLVTQANPKPPAPRRSGKIELSVLTDPKQNLPAREPSDTLEKTPETQEKPTVISISLKNDGDLPWNSFYLVLKGKSIQERRVRSAIISDKDIAFLKQVAADGGQPASSINEIIIPLEQLLPKETTSLRIVLEHENKDPNQTLEIESQVILKEAIAFQKIFLEKAISQVESVKPPSDIDQKSKPNE